MAARRLSTCLPMPRPAVAESDSQLFQLLGAADAPRRKDAQQRLYQRHVRYLYGVVHKQRDKLLQLAGLSVDDVVHDTFQRAFERAHTFHGDPTLDDDRARRRTRAWLGRIAQNLIVDSFRRFREVSASDYLEHVPAPSDEACGDDAPASRPDLEPVRAAFAALSDREQDVLRVTALYFKAEGRQRLPNEVSAELSVRWGISNDAVRAIRSRALRKLRSAMGAAEETT